MADTNLRLRAWSSELSRFLMPASLAYAARKNRVSYIVSGIFSPDFIKSALHVFEGLLAASYQINGGQRLSEHDTFSRIHDLQLCAF